MAALTGSGLTRRQFLAGAAGVGLAAAAARSPVRGYTAPADSPALVDASSFYGKLMFGYQGWFGTPGDGSAMDQWQHWCRGGHIPVRQHDRGRRVARPTRVLATPAG